LAGSAMAILVILVLVPADDVAVGVLAG